MTIEAFYMGEDLDFSSAGVKIMSFAEIQALWEEEHLELLDYHVESGENEGTLDYAVLHLRKLFILEKAIIHLKKFIPESRFQEIQKLTYSTECVFLTSKFMRRRQKKLRCILEEIVRGKDLYEIVLFEELLEIYNRICGSKLEMASNGDFYNKMHSLKEELFKVEGDFTHVETVEYPGLISVRSIKEMKPYRIAMIFCVVEFFRSVDTRKIKYCKNCKEFFISKTIRPSKYCSDKCRMAYNNRKNIKSGKAKEYKRRKRMEGAKVSYYG